MTGQGLDPVAVVVNQPSVHPDSSSTLSPGRCVTLLLPILIAAPGFVGKRVGE